MSTTTLQELDVIFNLANKYKEFQPLESAPKDDKELIIQYIQLNLNGYKETLSKENEARFVIPETFRKELQDCADRCQRYVDADFKNLYYWIDRNKVRSNQKFSKKQLVEDIIYVMSFEEL